MCVCVHMQHSMWKLKESYDSEFSYQLKALGSIRECVKGFSRVRQVDVSVRDHCKSELSCESWAFKSRINN